MIADIRKRDENIKQRSSIIKTLVKFVFLKGNAYNGRWGIKNTF